MNKKGVIFFLCILGCILLVLAACGGESKRSQKNVQKPILIDYSDVQNETVRYFRENIYQRYVFSLQNESPIRKSEDRHASNVSCDMCGKHIDLLRADSVDIDTIETIDVDMHVSEVYALIGNPHFGFKDLESYNPTVSSSIGVDENYFFYYVLSDKNVLEIEYDKETNNICKLKQITASEFIALYPAVDAEMYPSGPIIEVPNKG